MEATVDHRVLFSEHPSSSTETEFEPPRARAPSDQTMVGTAPALTEEWPSASINTKRIGIEMNRVRGEIATSNN